MRRLKLVLVALAAALMVTLGVGTGLAFAYSLVISNGYYSDPAGVFAARHSLTKVDVTNTSPAGSGNQACENALNTNGTWAQSYSYCANSGGGYVYHPFCGCQLRYGWNGPLPAAWMVGVEVY